MEKSGTMTQEPLFQPYETSMFHGETNMFHLSATLRASPGRLSFGPTAGPCKQHSLVIWLKQKLEDLTDLTIK
jgi:hypothetical protein